MTEEWREVACAPGYQVSDHGHVTGKRKQLKLHKNPDGYQVTTVYIEGKPSTHFVHRLVALAFIPNPLDKPIVDHVNHVREDNRVSNLRWSSLAENRANAVSSKTATRGKRVVQIDRHSEDHIRIWDSRAEAGRALGISPSGISSCCQGIQHSAGGWKWKYYDDIAPEIEGEVWRPIPSEMKVRGEVSSHGRVKTVKGGITLGHVQGGYYTIGTGKQSVHRLVAILFPDVCPKPESANIVNHKDGNKLNNVATNLEWTTPAGNIRHAHALGLISTATPVCRHHPDGSMTEYPSMAEAERQTGIYVQGISSACNGKRKTAGWSEWTYIEKEDPVAAMNAYIDSLLDD